MEFTNHTVIIADDDDDDKTLILDALLENGISASQVILTSDGEELLSLLPKYAHSPCIVILDLNMPRKDGRRTLLEIKTDELLKHIPVIIFTTSSSYTDILSTYKFGANTFFTKPFQYSELVSLVGVIKAYWFEKALIGMNDHN